MSVLIIILLLENIALLFEVDEQGGVVIDMVELDERVYLTEFVHIDDEDDEKLIELDCVVAEVDDEVELIIRVVVVLYADSETNDEMVVHLHDDDEVELLLLDVMLEVAASDELEELENIV